MVMESDAPALQGIRVLDVSTVLAAPVTATFLGDFGAEVVKVEEPGRGDFTRMGPGAQGVGGRSLHWLQEGRNKKSVTIDLRTERGQRLLRRMVPHFDVVVTSYRPPTLEDVLGPLRPPHPVAGAGEPTVRTAPSTADASRPVPPR